MKIKTSLVLGIAVVAFAMATHAQTNPVPTDAAVQASGATNTTPLLKIDTGVRNAIVDDVKAAASSKTLTVDLYGTYAPGAPTQIGGGVAVGHDFTGNVGAFFALDWLGQFNLVSGNLDLKLPMHPIASLTNFVVEPLVIVGITTPFSGAGHDNGGIGTVEGGGVKLSLGSKWGIDWGTGIVAENWTGAGAYNGWHGQLFFGGRHGF